ncbi:MAG: CHASE domain-containing protein [Gammaproteobacteria bacterium]|nr:CHASE domain-containing protein [Gammaproteobacteria bacterium]
MSSTDHSGRNEWVRGNLIAWMVLLVCLLMTVWGWVVSRENALEQGRLYFDGQASQMTLAIKNRMQGYEQVLRGGVAYFSASKFVERGEWRQYVTGLDLARSFPGIQGVGFAKRITSQESDIHERSVRGEGFPYYSIKPEGQRPEYYPVIYLEPFAGRNLRAFGYDMYSESVRRAAMDQARDTGAAVISGKVTLVQETGQNKQAGFLMYLPLYANGLPKGTLAERRAAMLGFIYSPFRVNDLMQVILGREWPGIRLEVFDGRQIAPEARLYGESPEGQENYHPLFTQTVSIDVGGHPWTLRFFSDSAFDADVDQEEPWIILVGGVVLSILLATVIWMLSTYRVRALSLANRMTGELRKNEAVLRETTTLQQAILDSADFAIISTDQRGVISTFNASAERMLGYAAQDLVGKCTPAILHDPDEVVRRAQGLSAELGVNIEPGFDVFVAKARLGESDENQWSCIRKDGGRFKANLSVTALRDSQGVITGFLGIAYDVTERMRILDDLNRFKDVLDNTLDMIFMFEPDSLRFVYVSRGAVESMGYTRDELLTMTPCQIKPLMPESVFRGAIAPLISGEKPSMQFETVHRHKDGHDFPVEIFLQLVKTGEGKGLFVAIVRDITERKKIDLMKNEFVSTVSHELRTPLTSIRGSLGLLAGGVAGELPARAKPLIDIAYKNSERLVHLINDILDIEKIESGKMTFDIRPQALMPLIELALESNHAYGEQYGVRFELVAALPGVKVSMDSDRLMQVMSNLLSNAAKFSPPNGRVDINVERRGSMIRVSVADQGAGIAPAFRDKIFQKFSQADTSDTRQKGGTGLGLSISKAIIERMGGQLAFDAQRETGATFYFDFPEWREGPAEGDNADSLLPRVLVCEDDPDVAAFLDVMLKEGGFDVDVAHDAAHAKQMLGANSYAAMTLDIGLPDQNGVLLIRELRDQEATRTLPIIVVSAQVEQAREEMNGGGFAVLDWFSKPIDQGRLLGALKQAAAEGGNHKPRILHVEDDPDVRQVVSSMAQDIADFDYAGNLRQVADKLDQQRYDLIILDLGLPDGSGWDVLPLLSTLNPQPPVVVFSVQNVTGEDVRKTAAALVKSQVSNQELIDTLSALIKQSIQ